MPQPARWPANAREQPERIVYLRWVDSCHHLGWTDLDEIRHDALELETIGWLIHADEKTVTVSSTVGDEQAHCPLKIPRAAILKMWFVSFL